MRARPYGVTDEDVAAAVVAGWGLSAESLRYAPVGAGSYHWLAGEYFVTVDDLDNKPWLGATRGETLSGLRAAMDTASALATLPFVLAPIDGTVYPLGDRYAMTVFPYLDGTPGEWGQQPADDVLDLLAALHNAKADVTVPPRPVALPGRGILDGTPSTAGPFAVSGPFADQVRTLLTDAGPHIRDLLATFDRLALAAADLPRVITHGEPHPGNVLRTAAGPMLVDWDTVGLAPPERDLWFLGAAADFTRYEATTGYRPSAEVLELYRLRWRLDDICAYVAELRLATTPNEDTEHALRTLRSLTSPPD
jgi:spectinomycin phosphotransferase